MVFMNVYGLLLQYKQVKYLYATADCKTIKRVIIELLMVVVWVCVVVWCMLCVKHCVLFVCLLFGVGGLLCV